jgi:hypothetical protein
MVSQSEQRRRKRVPLACSALAGVALIAAAVGACSRRAEIENAPDAGAVMVTEIPRPEGGVPVVDESGLEADVDACQERVSQAECSGANDFGCDFDHWLRSLSDTCQARTGCQTNGWLEVLTNPEGCAVELRMQDPDLDFVSCLASELNPYRCGTCGDVLGARFLGASNDGCPGADVPCGTGEIRCAPGSTCEKGICVENAAGAGSD